MLGTPRLGGNVPYLGGMSFRNPRTNWYPHRRKPRMTLMDLERHSRPSFMDRFVDDPLDYFMNAKPWVMALPIASVILIFIVMVMMLGGSDDPELTSTQSAIGNEPETLEFSSVSDCISSKVYIGYDKQSAGQICNLIFINTDKEIPEKYVTEEFQISLFDANQELADIFRNWMPLMVMMVVIGTIISIFVKVVGIYKI